MRISNPAFGSGLFDRVAAKWFFAAVAVLFAPWLRASLVNPGFESGTVNSAPPSPWVTQLFKNPGIANYPPQTFADLGLIAGGVANTVIVGGAGPGTQSDAALGAAASLRWPLVGVRSAIVNGPASSAAGANQNVNVLSQTMTIVAGDVDPSDNKVHVRFSIDPVIQYGNHLPAQEAYMFVEVTNVTQSTQLFHAFYNFDYDGFDVWKTLVTGGSTFYYTNWQAIDISPGLGLSVGDMVRVTLVAAGCVPGTHEAHLYVDSSMQASGISVTAAGPATAVSPGTITYTFSYSNHGVASDTGVVIDVTPPPPLTFASLTPPPGATCVSPAVGSSGTITCTFSSPMPAGTQGSFTTTFNVPANTPSPIHLRNYDTHSNNQFVLLGPPVDTAVTSVTATALTSNANPATFGQSVTFTAAVTGQSPTGTVTFKDSATAICTAVALSSGSAGCSTSTLSVGPHSITAVYSGDTNNAASTSNILTQQVNQSSTTTSLATSCMTTFVENQPFTMTASVSGAVPTGNVSFSTQANVVVCGNLPLSSGSASCTTNALAVVGSATEQGYSLSANYAGDVDNAPSTSTPIMVTVLKASDVVFRDAFETDLPSCPVE